MDTVLPDEPNGSSSESIAYSDSDVESYAGRMYADFAGSSQEEPNATRINMSHDVKDYPPAMAGDPRDDYYRNQTPPMGPGESPEGQQSNSRSRFRCHDWHIPTSCAGPKIWMDVEIHTTDNRPQVDTKGIASWSWPTSPGQSGTEAQQLSFTRISTAKRWYNTSGDHRLDLTTLTKAGSSSDTALKWLHVCQQKPSFDDFQAIALNAPGLTNDWKIVVLSLLETARENYAGGRDWEWGAWLLRADSSALGRRTHHDINLTAMTVSFPYFATHDKASNKSVIDARMSLLHPDFEQLFPTMTDGGSLHVPQLWAIVMNNSRRGTSSLRHCSNVLSAAYVRPSFVRGGVWKIYYRPQ